MDRYDPGRRVGMIVDEWGTWFDVEPGTNPGFLYQQNTLRDALVAGLTLNLFNEHCERVHMANIAQTINVLQAMILTEGERMLCTPTYHVFQMYAVHQDATRLPLTLESEDYRLGDETLPAAASPWPLGSRRRGSETTTTFLWPGAGMVGGSSGCTSRSDSDCCAFTATTWATTAAVLWTMAGGIMWPFHAKAAH